MRPFWHKSAMWMEEILWKNKTEGTKSPLENHVVGLERYVILQILPSANMAG